MIVTDRMLSLQQELISLSGVVQPQFVPSYTEDYAYPELLYQYAEPTAIRPFSSSSSSCSSLESEHHLMSTSCSFNTQHQTSFQEPPQPGYTRVIVDTQQYVNEYVH